MEKEPFYMVFVEGEQTPVFKHLSHGSALNEAKRLTEKTGKTSYVLGTIKIVSPPEKVIVEDFSVNELPF